MTTLSDLIARLEGHSGCWIWPRKKDKNGRGRIWIGGKLTLAHRAVWEHFNDAVPVGKMLCHTCDNPSCVNPRHLYVGTHADNMRDMKERRRYFAAKEPTRFAVLAAANGRLNTWARGAKNPKAKLSTADVQKIRNSKAATKVLAARYDVHRTTIQKIRSGAQWS